MTTVPDLPLDDVLDVGDEVDALVAQMEDVFGASPEPMECSIDDYLASDDIDVAVPDDPDPLVQALLPELDPSAWTRRLIRVRLRTCPPSVGGPIRRLHSAGLQARFVDEWEGLVEAEAGKEGLTKTTAGQRTEYMCAIDQRRIARQLVARGEADRLRAEIGQATRAAHMFSQFGRWPSVLPSIASNYRPPRRGSTWTVQSWLGLSTAAMPESLPEGLAIGLAQRWWDRRRHLGTYPGSERPAGKILCWGALSSTMALALMATAPEGLSVEVDEVDVVGQAQSIPWVTYRGHEIPDDGRYDLIVVHVPPPGAPNLRNRYKDLAREGQAERQLLDLGRLGPRKWRRSIRRLAPEVVRTLRPGAELHLVLPGSVRTATGYDDAPGLLDGFPEVIRGAGLRIVRTIDVVEENSVSQPVMGRARCPWRLLICRHRLDASDDDTIVIDTDDELAEALTSLDREMGDA